MLCKCEAVQMYKVNPLMEEPPHFRGKIVDDQILSFYKVNDVHRFTYSKPFRKGAKNKDNEFASMWIQRFTFTTCSKLPGILRWFEVNNFTMKELSPLENAVETMETSNRELRQLVMQYHRVPGEPINPLSMKLNGTVDPRVMGGFSNYEKAFFVDSYIKDNPDDHGKIATLKDLIASQIPLLDEGVRLHGELAPAALKPFHQNMETCFQDLKANVEKNYGKKPPFIAGGAVRRPSPQHSRTMQQPRPESILSIQSTTSDHSTYGGENGPPEVPVKKRGGNTPVGRSTSMAIPDRSNVANRRSKTSEWFVNFGSNNSLDKSGTSLTSNSSTGNGTVELREELTPQRPRRPKSSVGMPTMSSKHPPSPNHPPRANPPPLPVKQCGDYGNLPGDEVPRKHESVPLSPIPANKKPPPPLPVKRQESNVTRPFSPPKKPMRPAKSP